MPVYRLEIETRRELGDALAEEARRRILAALGVGVEALRTRKVYHLALDIDGGEAERVRAALTDPVGEVSALGVLPDGDRPDLVLTISFRPGVTDTVGRTVRRAAEDTVGRGLHGEAYSAVMYRLWGVADEAARDLALVLHNPLIERVVVETLPRSIDLHVPVAGLEVAPAVSTVRLRGKSTEELVALSQAGMWALTGVEMEAIARHFDEMGRDPTDAEMECLAQTWSEHCKHKIFAAPIRWIDETGSEHMIEEGLFARYIKGATTAIARRREEARLDPVGAGFLVSVFHDNAGVVRFTDADHLVYKVETHNSPSALDPYGGAMTGIVGVNRDTFGTGLGSDLLTNVWGYCLASPAYAGRIPKGLMHPRRIRDGVHAGVIDGGNQSGVPYSRGFELFDARYAGKPLVFCGTVGVMPVRSAGHETHRECMQVGDLLVMIGGRIGKDGIHGATFSSVELDEAAPVQAVQIGDPITQKMMFDMLTEARELGFLSGLTDNGAGGLSSSVGEMARATGGATLDLAKAPLKYPGLAPWEILVSEAQERMTAAVPRDRVEALLELASRREVEVTVLGELTDSGRFVVHYGDTPVVDLSLAFLHDAVPRVVLQARLESPRRRDVKLREVLRPGGSSFGEALVELLGHPGQASQEERVRHYDHEVKGLSVVKPLVGRQRNVPAVATVLRARHLRSEGVVLGEGVHPWYSDVDGYEMAKACVDEAVRRVLCGGARMDRIALLDNFCWPDPVESPRTPDGAHKLAILVRACQGLFDACLALGAPLISGKDSMKNDAFFDGVKISIPPTLLVSAMGQLADVRAALTLEPRAAGDLVAVLGATHGELAQSLWAREIGLDAEDLPFGENVPRTDLEQVNRRYRAFEAARDAGLVRSAQVVTRGGLAMAFAMMVIAAEEGLALDLDAMATGLSDAALLFSESTGRIIVTAKPEHREALERLLGPQGLVWAGKVGGPGLVVRRAGRSLIELPTSSLSAAFAQERPWA